MVNPYAFILLLLAIILAPLLLGIINRTKAICAGRTGQPLVQVYYDVVKLLRKESVYSQTTTWIFRISPVLSFAGLLLALSMIPWGGLPAIVSFPGDFIVVFYLLGIGRFFTILAALDTGSSFEGMGASREAFFSALTEPILFSVMITLARLTGEMSLSHIFQHINGGLWLSSGAALILLVVILFVLLLTENSRIPVDDPNTHLELTMIHEVMVLDHSGPDFGLILASSACKLWLFAALLAGIFIPIRSGNLWIDGLLFLLGVMITGVVVGLIESSMARLRLLLVPRMLVGASAIAAICIFLTLK